MIFVTHCEGASSRKLSAISKQCRIRLQIREMSLNKFYLKPLMIFDVFKVNREHYSNELEYLQVRNTFTIHAVMILYALVAAIINFVFGRFTIGLLEFLAFVTFLPMLYLYPKKLYQYNAFILNCLFVGITYFIAFKYKNDITILSIAPLAIVIGFLMNGNRLGLITALSVLGLNISFLSYTDFVAPSGKSADYLNLVMSPTFTYFASLIFSSNLRKSLVKVTALLENNLELSYQNNIAKLGGAVAHEINNPLFIISGLVDFVKSDLQKENFDKERLITMVNTISGNTHRISNITGALLDISDNPAEEPESEVISIDHLVDTALTLCSEKIKSKNIELSLNNSSSGSIIKCRWRDVARALLSVLDNAIDAIDETNAAWISLDVYVTETKIANFKITDSGRGNADRILKALETPYFTTKDIRKGSGLGLSIANRVISNHGGTIALDQSSSHTCIHIVIPVVIP